MSIAVNCPEPVIIDRLTRGGRRLWYHLDVIQQPERARACGAGPKSSADRRPVDPPPVVELRIFEGPTLEVAKDITFMYNANFFLYATLEHARVIAHGRVQTPAAATPPVLTGMPVSGMAYLDRPKEAGYFSFPDLSVRHEGRYRLSFNLFEQTKEPGDFTKDMHDPSSGESFDWRMEVKSNDFMVFSAKKFPGLTESTALSRTVAEQGCRVRIRRDVRIRRRDGKATATNSDARAAEEEYIRRQRTQTPETIRGRSASNENLHRTPYGHSHPPTPIGQRRPSMGEYDHIPIAPSPQHQQIAPATIAPPAFGSSSQGNGSTHLRFGNGMSAYGPPGSVPPSPTHAPSSFNQPPPISSPVHHPHQHPSHLAHSHPQQPHHQQQQQQQQHPQQHSQHQQRHSQHMHTVQQHMHHPSHAHHHSSSYSAPPPPLSPSPHAYNTHQDRPPSQHFAPPRMASPSPVPTHAVHIHHHAPSPRRDSFSASVEERHRITANYSSAPSGPTEMSMDRLPEAPRSMPSIMSPLDSTKSMTLPSLSEMISKAPPPPPPPSSSTDNSNTAPNNKNDRVPSLSQLLLPQPVLPSPISSAPGQSASGPMGKKRTFGQYNNVDPEMEAYASQAPVKNHARQVDSASREYPDMLWKRADGSVWSTCGEVSQPRA